MSDEWKSNKEWTEAFKDSFKPFKAYESFKIKLQFVAGYILCQTPFRTIRLPMEHRFTSFELELIKRTLLIYLHSIRLRQATCARYGPCDMFATGVRSQLRLLTCSLAERRSVVRANVLANIGVNCGFFGTSCFSSYV